MPGGQGAVKHTVWSQYSPIAQYDESRQRRTGGGGGGGSLHMQISQPVASRAKPNSQ